MVQLQPLLQWNMANDYKSRETRQRLEKCWTEDIDWELLPATLRDVYTYWQYRVVMYQCVN